MYKVTNLGIAHGGVTVLLLLLIWFIDEVYIYTAGKNQTGSTAGGKRNSGQTRRRGDRGIIFWFPVWARRLVFTVTGGQAAACP
jgi:hypothetical protein